MCQCKWTFTIHIRSNVSSSFTSLYIKVSGNCKFEPDKKVNVLYKGHPSMRRMVCSFFFGCLSSQGSSPRNTHAMESKIQAERWKRVKRHLRLPACPVCGPVPVRNANCEPSRVPVTRHHHLSSQRPPHSQHSPESYRAMRTLQSTHILAIIAAFLWSSSKAARSSARSFCGSSPLVNAQAALRDMT